MSMTQTQKIIAAHCGRDHVSAGQFVEMDLDLVLGNDITTPVAIDEFVKMGATKVFDREKIAIVLDHFTPAKDIQTAELTKKCREFAGTQEIVHFFDVGRAGIEHALLPEQGIVASGEVIIGADSHTCTYGAVGAFATGIGSTDMAAGMARGKGWFRVPAALRFILHGKLQQYCSGKDVILHIIGMIGVDGARYKSMEFCGDGIASLSMDDRLTIANMSVEAGAKNGIFPVDEVCTKYLNERVKRSWKSYEADPDAEYEQTYEIDLASLKPTLAVPHLPENCKTIDEIGHIRVDQVVIGSCTNGRIQDMRQAAAVLKGRKLAKHVRAIIIPATQEIFNQCIREGLAEIFTTAGAVFSTPTCGPCIGGHMGILAGGEVAVSTTNRNFIGRMGAKGSQVYLANPEIAAASAVAGYIVSPAQLASI